MFHSLIRDATVKLFGLIAALGLHRIALFNRLFLAAYGFYKRHFEAGPIDRLQEFVPHGSLVRDQSHLTLSLIKIDVQGAEMLVLEGAASTLQTLQPALFVELHEEGLNRFGTSVAAILAHLAGRGYQAYWLMPSGPHATAAD